MELHEAWKILGKDLNKIMINIKNMSTFNDRIQAVIHIKEGAKKIAKKLMAENHPDKGGSSSAFISIQEALKVIESKTEDLIGSHQSIISERKRKKGNFLKIK
jgi:hypothetical protein